MRGGTKRELESGGRGKSGECENCLAKITKTNQKKDETLTFEHGGGT